MLHFGMKPPLSYADFLDSCASELTQSGMDILRETDYNNNFLKEWESFNRGLNNELVRTRAAKKGKDPNKYLREDSGMNPFIAPLAHWSVNQDSPMEAELYLDRVRWDKIEEIKTGHYFDIEYLLAYGLQLRILERWHRINSADGVKVLETLTGKI